VGIMDKLFSEVKENIPALPMMVYMAKNLNEQRGVDDTMPNVVAAMMAILGNVAQQEKDELRPVIRPNKHLDKMEAESAEHLRRINEINNKIRTAIDDYNGLVLKVKEAKEHVVEEYRDVLGQFRDIMENSEGEGNTSMSQFHTILEDVIKEVLLENDAIDMDEEEEEKNEFEALFEDQQLIDAFDGVFAQDSVLTEEQEALLPPPPPTSTPPPPTQLPMPTITITETRTSRPLRRRNGGVELNIG
jgi:hypothetical protein